MDLLPPNRDDKAENRNLITAIALCAVIIIGFDYVVQTYFPNYAAPAIPASTVPPYGGTDVPPPVNLTTDSFAPTLVEAAEPALDGLAPTVVLQDAATVLAQQADTLEFGTPYYRGQLNRRTGRIVSLTLQNLGAGRDDFQLFSTTGAAPQFIETGWLAADDVQWELVSQTPTTLDLQAQTPAGVLFQRQFQFDPETYLIAIQDAVSAPADTLYAVQHYAQIVRGGGHLPGESSTWLNYFGPLGLANGVLQEHDFADVQEQPVHITSNGGWWGISSQYFLSALIPSAAISDAAISDAALAERPAETTAGGDAIKRFTYTPRASQPGLYAAIVQQPKVSVTSDQPYQVRTHVYVGPKSLREIQEATAQIPASGLDRAIDYGWFAVIAGPMHSALVWLYAQLGNLGLAIIALTIGLKLLTLPLTWKSMQAMARLKQLQPEMQRIQEKYKDLNSGREKMALEMMELYKKEKVNPLSGCWPILIQMPIFFAMYKMMLISFEVWHAPFYGWITDLSALDPYFVLPVLMGASMWLQMKLSPQAGDPMQQQIMQMMPIVFTVMFLFFPSGLVLYWLTNNVFSIGQQYLMLRQMGHK